MEDQAMLMKTRMRSLSLPYALKVKSPETIAKESGQFVVAPGTETALFRGESPLSRIQNSVENKPGVSVV